MANSPHILYDSNYNGVTSSGSWASLASSGSFTVQGYTKYVVLGTAFSKKHSPYGTGEEDPYFTTDNPSEFALTIDGVTECETKQSHCSFLWFGELDNSTHSVRIYGKSSTTCTFYGIRLIVFGVEDWDYIEQNTRSAVLTGTSTSSSKILLQQLFYPKYSDVVVFSYAEMQPSATTNARSQLKFYLDDELTPGNVFLNSVVGPSTNWHSISSAQYTKVGKGLHSLKFATQKMDLTNIESNFRRLRAVAIPVNKNPFVSIQSFQELDRKTLTGEEFLSVDEKEISLLQKPQTFDDAKYLVVASGRSGPSSTGQRGIFTARYAGLSLSTFSTAGTTTAMPGITTAKYDDIFNVGTERLSLSTTDPSVFPIQGASLFGFHYKEAEANSTDQFFIRASFNSTWNGGPPDSDLVSIRTEGLNLLALQFQKNLSGFSPGNNQTTKDLYAKRTLVEVVKHLSISRYCLEQDVYLLDGLTSGEIVTKIQSGDIDRESVLTLFITGRSILEAIDSGETSTAEQLIDLQTGTPEGVSDTSPDSEYVDFSSLAKLYKTGVVDSITIAEKPPDSFYGVLGSTNLSVNFNNSNGSFINENPLDELENAELRVRYYDPINQTLKTHFSGRLADFTVNTKCSVTAINPDLESLDISIPKHQVLDANIVNSNNRVEDGLVETETNFSIPLFFGTAKRIRLPVLYVNYGTEDLSIPFLDAYTDYAVGGPYYNTDFKYILPNKTNSPTSLYRAWLAIEDSVELNDQENVTQFNKYTVGGSVNSSVLPSIRFSSYPITTSTRTGQIGLPLLTYSSSTDVGSTTYRLYPQFTPVTKFIYAGGFAKGDDWITDPANPNAIKWVGLTSNQPIPHMWGAVQSGVTRTATQASSSLSNIGATDLILVGATNSRYAEVINVNSALQAKYDITNTLRGTVNYTKDVHYSVSSSDGNRALQDKITWNKEPSLRGSWEFNGTLDDTLGLNGLTGQFRHQPVFNEDNTCLEFNGDEGDGLVYKLDSLVTPSTQLDFTGTQDFRLIVFLQANDDLECKGVPVGKTIGPSSGFYLEVLKESDIYLDGSNSKWIPRIRVSDGSSYQQLIGATTVGVNLSDGLIHKVDFRVKRNFLSNGYDYAEMYLDNTLVSTRVNVPEYSLTNAGNFTVGGADISSPSYRGKIHKISLLADAIGEPGTGQTYSVNWNYVADSFFADWEYDYVEASNTLPVNRGEDSVYQIGADLKVAGSDIEAANITGTLLPFVGSTTAKWVKGDGNSGYAIRFNTSPGTIGAGWALGVSQLGSGTTLAGVSGVTPNGYLSIGNTSTLMKFLGNFTVYFMGRWLGASGPDTLAIAKERASGVPSYCLGLQNGKPYGSVLCNGVNYVIQGNTNVDTSVPIFMHMSRVQNNLYIYVNGTLEGHIKVPRSLDSDYDSGPLVVSSSAISGFSKWVGDISFFGVTEFGGGGDFGRLQVDAFNKGIKGMFTEKVVGNDRRQTKLHFPLTEGTGNTVKNRNTHRNSAQAIKRLILDRTIGVADPVDVLEFDKAITAIDDLNLKTDFVQLTPEPAIDILSYLTMIRGISLKKNSIGEWTLDVDSLKSVVRAKFGSGDSVFNNIITVGGLRIRSSEESIKLIQLEYNYIPNSTGELVYASRVERLINSYGSEVKVYKNPYIIDHTTADKVIDYLAKKLKQQNKILNITVGQEGADLRYNDLIEVTIPRLGITQQIYQIISVSRDGTKNTFELIEASSQPYTYNPGPVFDDEAPIISGDQEGFEE